MDDQRRADEAAIREAVATCVAAMAQLSLPHQEIADRLIRSELFLGSALGAEDANREYFRAPEQASQSAQAPL